MNDQLSLLRKRGRKKIIDAKGFVLRVQASSYEWIKSEKCEVMVHTIGGGAHSLGGVPRRLAEIITQYKNLGGVSLCDEKGTRMGWAHG